MNEFLNVSEIKRFEAVLASYSMGEAEKNLFIDSRFGNIAGPAGAGKDTLRNLLADSYPDKYAKVISTTTRPARRGESDGIDYHFENKEEVYEKLMRREFFQASLVHNQQVSCLHIDEIKKLKAGQRGLGILIVQTDLVLRRIKPDIKTLFIVPPDLSELKRRMLANRNLSEEEMTRRLTAAKRELEIGMHEQDYYCLVNDGLDQTKVLSRKFFEADERKISADEMARNSIMQILSEINRL